MQGKELQSKFHSLPQQKAHPFCSLTQELTFSDTICSNMAAMNTTLGNMLQKYTSTYDTTVTSNSTAPSFSDGADAAWYIVTVIGIFAVVIFGLMVNNLTVNKVKDDCEPYFQYIEQQGKKNGAKQKLAMSKLVKIGQKDKLAKLKAHDGQVIVEKQREGAYEKKTEEQPQEHAVGPDALQSIKVKT